MLWICSGQLSRHFAARDVVSLQAARTYLSTAFLCRASVQPISRRDGQQGVDRAALSDGLLSARPQEDEEEVASKGMKASRPVH